MAGRPGRSGGHNRLPLEAHILRGTFNPTRHRRRAASRPVPPGARAEAPPADLVDGLTGRGAAFVTRTWTLYGGWTPSTLALLYEAGRLLDDLDHLRGTKGERPTQRLLIAVLGALRLED